MEKRVYTKSYTTIDVRSINDGYQRLGEAIVALAFQDYLNGEKARRKISKLSIFDEDFRPTSRLVAEGESAKKWLMSSPDASFYAGPSIDIQRVFKVVAARLEED